MMLSPKSLRFHLGKQINELGLNMVLATDYLLGSYDTT